MMTLGWLSLALGESGCLVMLDLLVVSVAVAEIDADTTAYFLTALLSL